MLGEEIQDASLAQGWWIRFTTKVSPFPYSPNFVWRGGWWIRFAFLIPSAGMRNNCSHQFLNWWQQVSTGHLHLNGFESHHRPKAKQKPSPLGLGFCFGGGWWIRTTEGIASRFTVCPLWPLGKSPILNSVRWSR